jgi:gliding motility-associated-like protein
MYRDCFSSGAAFDDTASIGIYDVNNALIANLRPPLLTSSVLPLTAPNNCTTLPNTVCTEKATYKVTINLPPTVGGYTITHQRCCRNSTILNIPNPDDWGSTYTVSIPSNDQACNSSPTFNSTPPVVLCVNQNLNLDMSASTTDGDSLSYSLCQVKHGGGKSSGTGFTSPAPNPPAPPSYTNVPFNNGFSPTSPITSSPTIQINPVTGFLKGRPTQLGQYVFAICVTEWRNGQIVSVIRRDFQFNVSGDCKGPVSQIEDQVENPNTLCIGRTIQFKSISANTTSWHWDFGDPNTNLDTSILANPSYTYADTGTYEITLVANPGVCPDTSKQIFRVYYPVSIDFDYSGQSCFPNNSLSFEPIGNVSNEAIYSWDFGGNTNIGTTSNLKEPAGVSFLQEGGYEVTLTVSDFDCSASISKMVYVYPYPVINSDVPELQACVPATVFFNDSSIAFGLAYHTWVFGDGDTSNDKSPLHTYTEPGLYTVKHWLVTTQGCLDTVYEEYPLWIEVFPTPQSNLSIDPPITSIYDPVVTLENTSSVHTRTETYLPDGRVITDLNSETLTFEDTGTYPITHISFNEFGCTDTVVENIIVDAPVNIFIPNAFSPNGDGINDELLLSITDINEFHFMIFNRWGERVFESNEQEYTWNGNVMNVVGNPAKPEVYSYRLRVRTNENARHIVQHGTITLIR